MSYTVAACICAKMIKIDWQLATDLQQQYAVEGTTVCDSSK